MKVKVIIAALLLAGAGMSANAQSTDDNWFLQGQLGASYSLDGTGIGKLISPWYCHDLFSEEPYKYPAEILS